MNREAILRNLKAAIYFQIRKTASLSGSQEAEPHVLELDSADQLKSVVEIGGMSSEFCLLDNDKLLCSRVFIRDHPNKVQPWCQICHYYFLLSGLVLIIRG